MRKLIIGLMAIMLALPALAQKAPEGVPERDAVITFRASKGAEVIMEWTLALTSGGRLRRIDMAGISTSVMDMQTGAGFQVITIPGQRQPMVMDTAPGSKQSPMNELVDEQRLRFTSKGSDKVLDIPCEKTEARDEKGLTVICCRTILPFRGGIGRAEREVRFETGGGDGIRTHDRTINPITV
jgi:hypothetical protein